MPFIRSRPQPNLREWSPSPGDFDSEIDRLRVTTDWGDSIILSWSHKEADSGIFVIAPEAIPDNVRDYFAHTLDPWIVDDEAVQPYLAVFQNHDKANSLNIELVHPRFRGMIETCGHVNGIRPTRRFRNERYIPDLPFSRRVPIETLPSGHLVR